MKGKGKGVAFSKSIMIYWNSIDAATLTGKWWCEEVLWGGGERISSTWAMFWCFYEEWRPLPFNVCEDFSLNTLWRDFSASYKTV